MSSKDVLRKRKRNERRKDKELSARFNTESNLGEDFHTFKARVKKPKF